MTAQVSTLARTEVRQYSAPVVLAIWAAAAAPMGVAAWLVAPAIAGTTTGGRALAQALLACFAVGLIWQFVLVVGLVAREQRSLRWAVIRDALWLNPPSDAQGRRGGRLWWWAALLVLGFGVVEFAPIDPAGPASHNFGTFLGSDEGQAVLRGNWGLFALIVVVAVFNTVLGEELLFRGLLLPRMRGAFGRADWVANGILFGLYHWHQPWSMPSAVLTGLMAAYGTRRLRSAWLGIIAHSAQSVMFIVLSLLVVFS
jgi:membrane protease YdiL (CAAX protease family)